MIKRAWILVVGAALAVSGGCGVLGGGGLDASSTCSAFMEASPSEQTTLVIELVTAREGGRNPMREDNALMQLASACRSQPKMKVSEVAI